MRFLKEESVLQGHNERVWEIAWSPTGNLLASCSGDKTIRIWAPEHCIDPNSTENFDLLENNSQNCNSDGRKKKHPSNWTCKAVLEGAHQRTVRSIAWSPDGKFLASASFDATTSIWNVSSKSNGIECDCIATLEGHENEVKSVAWDSSGSLLATCSRDKTVWIWEMESDNDFECISVLHGHTQDVKTVLWHPNKEILFSCGYDDTIKSWQEEDDDWYCSATFTGHTSTVWDIAFDSYAERMVSCSDDRTLIIWDIRPGKDSIRRLCTLDGHHSRTVFSVDWSQTGNIVTGAGDDSIRIFSQVSFPKTTLP